MKTYALWAVALMVLCLKADSVAPTIPQETQLRYAKQAYVLSEATRQLEESLSQHQRELRDVAQGALKQKADIERSMQQLCGLKFGLQISQDGTPYCGAKGDKR